MSVEEGNKLIAEFMGGKLKHYNISNEPYYLMPDKQKWMPERLVYHSSWDCLKPVIDNIFTYALAYPNEVDEIRNMSIVVDIIPAWEKVVSCIEKLNKVQGVQVSDTTKAT